MQRRTGERELRRMQGVKDSAGLARADGQKDELLTTATAIAEHLPPEESLGSGAAELLIRRYYRHVAPEDIVGRAPDDLVGAAISQYRFAAKRPQGTASVRVFTPTSEREGWSCGHTVVEIVTDDMPFLVDSVSMELSRQQRAMHLLVHPQLMVRRDITGAMQEVCDTSDPDRVPDDAIVESWIHVEIDRVSGRDDLAAIKTDLERVLRDVREAVEDWPRMRHRASEIAEQLTADPPPIDPEEVSEGGELLRWLADDRFTFLGYREYVLARGEAPDGSDLLRAVPGTGLGILRADQPVSTSFSDLPPETRERAYLKNLLILTKANSRSTVHRPTYLDYVGVKTFDADGTVTGERRFLGLFTSSAYVESILRIPVLRRKAQEVLDRAGFPAASHSGKDLLEILETYPRDEMLQTSVEDLLPIAVSVLHLQERRRLRLFVRRDDWGRFTSCLVYLPRDRYTTQARLRIADILQEAFSASTVDYTARVSESVLARLHYVVRGAPGVKLPEVDVEEVEQRLVAATRSWADDLAEEMLEQCGEEKAAALVRRYADAFPEAYKEDFPARTGVADLRRLDTLQGGDDTGLNLYEPTGGGEGERRFKIYRVGSATSLSDVLPLLSRMGVEVVDERPYELHRSDGTSAWIYDFGLRYSGKLTGSEQSVEELFQDAFAAAWRGAAESDGFNALVLAGGMTWRQVMVLRAYAKYIRQGSATFSQDYIEECVTSNVRISRLLVRLFEARLAPAHDDSREDLVSGLVEEIEAALDDVASLDQDRILRSFLALVRATLRTNYFQVDADGNNHPYLSVKLDPQRVPDLPKPRPRFEIWVYSPRVEGVHLRFGPVARGGLRWSDRREDFRTEILGLVKAQAVKNAVIVPVGAKGGFVVKRPPTDPTDREAVLAEGIACYRTFIRGMLDITDNLVSSDGTTTVQTPSGVVRHDDDDTYLVVAADKGTATFSDIANEVAAEYGFWLGDAFASGGSAGYDHKAMGITARGAWESVKRHFRELGVDAQSHNFTVVGVGDMSGDVFGNGMLLSEHIRLVAAFDHRHVFLDPDPDPAVSFAERQRLFELPRSSWADYDSSLISKGGGVHPRSAKSISLTPQVRDALGIEGNPASMTPPELMRAIIAAPVDLFWNGGIGTYVKASTESNAEVGDKANDAIRVDGSRLRAKVVGEGGNLGLTQLGRIEFALNGGRINTDAIDNSAGVDTSDHEVNIKILLDRVVRDGGLAAKERTPLLLEMTEEVGDLVLADNYGQNVALAGSRMQAAAMLNVHTRYLRSLERDGEIDRALEFLPTTRQLTERRANGLGLTSPEFSVLLAYTKLTLHEQIVASDLPDDPYLRSELYDYFPTALRERFRSSIDEHPLRREIVTTRLVNDIVDNAGTTFAFRLREESGASADELARANIVASAVFEMTRFWRSVHDLDNVVDADVQTGMTLDGRRLVERACRWLLANRRSPIDIAGTIDALRSGVAEVTESLDQLVRGSDAEAFAERRDRYAKQGVPGELAVRAAGLDPAYAALDVVDVARRTGHDVGTVAETYFDLGDRLQISRLLSRITALPRDDRWKSMARAALRDDLFAAHAALTADVLASGKQGTGEEARFEAWKEHNEQALTRARGMLDEIGTSESFDLATLSVALRAIRTLLRTGS